MKNSNGYHNLETKEQFLHFVDSNRKKYSNFFNFFKDKFQLESLVEMLSMLDSNRTALKSTKWDIDKYIEDYEEHKNSSLILERLEDFIREVKRHSKSVSMVKRALWGRYSKFYKNEKDLNELANLFQLYVDNFDYKNSNFNTILRTKLKTFKNYSDLHLYVKNLYETLISNVDVRDVVDKVNKLGGLIAYNDTDFLVIDCNYKYEVCSVLGSKSWCIQSSKDQFISYMDNGSRKQYIVYDFSKDVTDPSRVFGVTVSSDGSIHESCDYDNKQFKSTYELEYYDHIRNYMKPVSNNVDDFINILNN